MRSLNLIPTVCILISSGLAHAPRFNPGDMVRQVSRSRLGPSADSRGPLVVDGGEFLIDTSGVEQQWLPAVAFDSANFLVVWEDYGTSNSDIYGARVTPQGTVLDRAGFVISQAANYQARPAVGFDGTNFLVVWQDLRNGSDYDIYGARVTPQGTVLDPAGFAISQAANDQKSPAVSFDGANFLVAWEDDRGGGAEDADIYGARVTPAGVVLDPTGIPISTATGWQASPSVAFDGANLLVAWEDHRGSDWTIYGARVTRQASVLDPTGFPISRATAAYGPTLAFDHSNFLAVWYADVGGQHDVYGARVTPQGTVLDSASFVISQDTGDQNCPAVCFDGANFLVAWQDYRNGIDWDIYGARVTQGGTVFDSGPIVSEPNEQSHPKLCYGNNGQTLLVYHAWTDTVGGKGYNNFRIWGKMVPNTGVAEGRRPSVFGSRLAASIVRGVLLLEDCPRTGTVPKSVLLDISGRKVMSLRPGANDVQGLAPGVYFVRSEPSAVSRKPSAVTRVVITR